MPPESALAILRTARSRGGPAAHVGVLVPWANSVVEAELPRFGLGTAVFHYARLVPPGRTTVLDGGFLRGLAAAVPGACAQLARLPPAGILLACTSAGFTAATDGNATGVVSAFDALVAALGRLRAARVALATPYPPPLTVREAAAFAGRGVGVVAHASLGRDDGFAGVAAEEIHALLGRLDPAAVADADALVLSCTGWPTAGLLAGIEGTLGIPVVSSNLAMAIYAAHLTATGEQP